MALESSIQALLREQRNHEKDAIKSMGMESSISLVIGVGLSIYAYFVEKYSRGIWQARHSLLLAYWNNGYINRTY